LRRRTAADERIGGPPAPWRDQRLGRQAQQGADERNSCDTRTRPKLRPERHVERSASSSVSSCSSAPSADRDPGPRIVGLLRSMPETANEKVAAGEHAGFWCAGDHRPEGGGLRLRGCAIVRDAVRIGDARFADGAADHHHDRPRPRPGARFARCGRRRPDCGRIEQRSPRPCRRARSAGETARRSGLRRRRDGSSVRCGRARTSAWRTDRTQAWPEEARTGATNALSRAVLPVRAGRPRRSPARRPRVAPPEVAGRRPFTMPARARHRPRRRAAGSRFAAGDRRAGPARR
jgi:hypothetical protein